MKLSKLLQGLNQENLKYNISGNKEIEVRGITDDSRKVKKDDLFVAIKGLHFDAHKFIPDVISSGAKVIVGTETPKMFNLKNVTYIQVENSRKALSFLASSWFGNPSKKLKIIGVTGTKGKTTTAEIIYQIIKRSGLKGGLVSSISAKIGNKEYDTGLHVTNPEPILLQSFLCKMVDLKCRWVVLEVTSHGIDQERVAGIHFDIAALTNIAPEHLDYHKTFEAYREAKAKLFKEADKVILNKDDKSFEFLKKIVGDRKKLISYGIKNKGDYFGCEIKIGDKMNFSVNAEDRTYRFRINMIGEYNVLNCLAAISVARQVGVDWSYIQKALEKLPKIIGRLEEIKNNKGFNIYIDFAHTPDSLEKVLELLKKRTRGKLVAVFGCAGERDALKRTKMGEISAKLADVSIFTAEDPRSEKVEDIIGEMIVGARRAGVKEFKPRCLGESTHGVRGNIYMNIPERGEGIAFAIQKIAQKGDTIVICGKGHEKSMCYGRVEYPWSDHEAVRAALLGKMKRLNHS